MSDPNSNLSQQTLPTTIRVLWKIMRHGTPDKNQNLSPEGRDEVIDSLNRNLNDCNYLVDALYTSPLARCEQSMEVARTHLNAKVAVVAMRDLGAGHLYEAVANASKAFQAAMKEQGIDPLSLPKSVWAKFDPAFLQVGGIFLNMLLDLSVGLADYASGDLVVLAGSHTNVAEFALPGKFQARALGLPPAGMVGVVVEVTDGKPTLTEVIPMDLLLLAEEPVPAG